MLMHLIEARDMTPEALAEVIDSSEVALQIINGDALSEPFRDRIISKIQAQALADYFHVDALRDRQKINYPICGMGILPILDNLRARCPHHKKFLGIFLIGSPLADLHKLNKASLD